MLFSNLWFPDFRKNWIRETQLDLIAPRPDVRRPAASSPAPAGATDDLGDIIIENHVHVHDLQAALMHRPGFNHDRLTFRCKGRDFRLADVHGHVIKAILA